MEPATSSDKIFVIRFLIKSQLDMLCSVRF